MSFLRYQRYSTTGSLKSLCSHRCSLCIKTIRVAPFINRMPKCFLWYHSKLPNPISQQCNARQQNLVLPSRHSNYPFPLIHPDHQSYRASNCTILRPPHQLFIHPFPQHPKHTSLSSPCRVLYVHIPCILSDLPF